MPLILWSDDYSVGVDSLDGDHIILFSLVNHLYAAYEAGKDARVIGPILAALARFSQVHFRREEALMRDTGYEEYDRHKEEHDQLSEQILDLQKRFARHGVEGLGEDIREFLMVWLVDHILNSDMRFKQHFRDAGA